MGMFDGARERIAIWIETRGGSDAIKTFDNIGGAAGRAGQQVEGRFTRLVNAGLQKLGIQSQVTGAALQTGVAAGATAAAAAVTAFVVKGVDAFASYAEKVRNVARETGLSAEESSRFVAVFDDLQISADAGGTALFRMARNVQVNSEALKAQGIEVKRNADGNLDMVGTLLNAADAYASTSDQGQKAAIAMALFGRGGKELIPVLQQGREGLEGLFAAADSHNQILSQDDLDKAEDYRLALDELDDAVQGFERAVGEDVVPTLTDLANGLAKVIDRANSLTEKVGGLGGAFKFAVGLLPGGLGPLAQGLIGIGDSSDSAASGQRRLAENTKAAADAADEQADALEKATKAVHDNVDAVLDAGDAEDKLGAALDKLAEVQSYDKAADVAAATQDLTSAQLSQEQAANRLTDAQARLNELKSKDLSLELRRAQLADRRAQQNAKEAASAKTRAETELARLRGDTASTPEQIAKAQEDLEEATLGVDEANQSAADSAKAVVDLQNPTKTTEYRDAVLAVKEAQNGVAQANDAVTAAHKKLNEVRAKDNSADITRATSDVQRAMEDVAKSGGTIDQQIAAYRRLETIVPPQFRQFIKDRIFELQALQYEYGQTQAARDKALAPPTVPPAVTGGSGLGEGGQAGGGAGGGGGGSGGSGGSGGGGGGSWGDGGGTPVGGVNAGPANRLESFTDGRTIINIDTVQAHDYEDFRLQMEAERRRNALAS